MREAVQHAQLFNLQEPRLCGVWKTGEDVLSDLMKNVLRLSADHDKKSKLSLVKESRER